MPVDELGHGDAKFESALAVTCHIQNDVGTWLDVDKRKVMGAGGVVCRQVKNLNVSVTASQGDPGIGLADAACYRGGSQLLRQDAEVSTFCFEINGVHCYFAKIKVAGNFGGCANCAGVNSIAIAITIAQVAAVSCQFACDYHDRIAVIGADATAYRAAGRIQHTSHGQAAIDVGDIADIAKEEAGILACCPKINLLRLAYGGREHQSQCETQTRRAM